MFFDKIVQIASLDLSMSMKVTRAPIPHISTLPDRKSPLKRDLDSIA